MAKSTRNSVKLTGQQFSTNDKWVKPSVDETLELECPAFGVICVKLVNIELGLPGYGFRHSYVLEILVDLIDFCFRFEQESYYPTGLRFALPAAEPKFKPLKIKNQTFALVFPDFRTHPGLIEVVQVG